MYDTINHNPDISCPPVDVTNLPHLVIRNDRLTTINNTTQMDLQDQAASESSGHRHISGSGGQLQFVRAMHRTAGSRSYVCRRPTNEPTCAACSSSPFPRITGGTVGRCRSSCPVCPHYADAVQLLPGLTQRFPAWLRGADAARRPALALVLIRGGPDRLVDVDDRPAGGIGSHR
jgi:Acetyl-CoA hydrolase/transferase C-terminal domain